ncbi:MAG: hypothetical protein ACXV6L_08990 [Halobacteriota archaeon]
MYSAKARTKFILEGATSVLRLSGIHPRWGPHWISIAANVNENTHEVEGTLGDVFKVSTAEHGEQYITIAENSTLKEINYIVFEDFMYSITRRWYNILQNTGTFKGQIEEE